MTKIVNDRTKIVSQELFCPISVSVTRNQKTDLMQLQSVIDLAAIMEQVACSLHQKRPNQKLDLINAGV